MSHARKPLAMGNWKMNLEKAQALAWCREAKAAYDDGLAASVDLAVAAPFVYLESMDAVLRGTEISLAGQACHWESSGAFTGEVSASMLKDVGCAMVLVGHSERRAMFHETEDVCARKTAAAFAAGLTPILCVGETLEQRQQNRTMSVIESQLRYGVGSLTRADADDLIVAYEPVWAIGTGEVATPEQAQAAHQHLRTALSQVFGDVGESTRILYGGSAKPGNAGDLIAQPDVDGFLVGGASLKSDSLLEIARAAC